MDILSLESDQKYATANNDYPDYGWREDHDEEIVYCSFCGNAAENDVCTFCGSSIIT